MFDIGFWEMAFISVIALLVIGPERLPRVARTLGLWIGKARRMINDVKRDFKNELDQAELHNLKELKDDIDAAGKELKKTADEAIVETEKSGTGLKEIIESPDSSTAPESASTPSAPVAADNVFTHQKTCASTAEAADSKPSTSLANENSNPTDTQQEPQNDLPDKAPA